MQFGHFLFQVLKTLSLITWYMDSPQTTSHGMRIANCTSFSLGCIEAGQDAVRNLKRCQTLVYFEIHKAEREEACENALEKEERCVTLWAEYEGGYTYAPTSINIDHDNHFVQDDAVDCKALLEAAAFHAPNRQQTLLAINEPHILLCWRIIQWLKLIEKILIAMIVFHIIIGFFRGPIDAQAPDSGAAEAL